MPRGRRLRGGAPVHVSTQGDVMARLIGGLLTAALVCALAGAARAEKDKGFKAAVDKEEKVGDKAAVVLKVTPPDGEEFKLYLDKDSGLPLKLTAKVKGFMNEDVMQETTYGDYKEMAGIKKASKLESK